MQIEILGHEMMIAEAGFLSQNNGPSAVMTSKEMCDKLLNRHAMARSRLLN